MRGATLVALVGVLGCGSGGGPAVPIEAPAPATVEARATPGRLAELDGSWFVRYHSDPKPYLDVAFRDGPRPTRVTADLQGPEGSWQDLELAFNEAENEWQVVCSFLPQPLAGGPWFVSAVRAWGQGSTVEYRSAAPWSPYEVVGAGAAGVEPGFFYASETGPLMWRIEAVLPQGGRPADPVLRVYRAGELRQWVAANDDWDVEQPYPAVVMPVEAGATYLIALSGVEDDSGHYALRAGPPSSGEAAPPLGVLPPDAPADPAAAVALAPGQWVLGELAGQDVDWFQVTVPR